MQRIYMNDTGFTLMELLISITIISVVIVIIFGSFRLGFKAVEKGESRLEKNRSYTTALGLIKHQINSLYTNEISDKRKYYLKGTAKEMAFISMYSLADMHGKNLTKVKYIIEKSEKNMNVLNIEEQALGMENNMETHAILTDMEKIAFDYLETVKNDNKMVWTENWNGDKKKAFPLAVRIKCFIDEGNREISIISKIALN